MVFQAARLWFYFIIYSRKDKYKIGYFIKEGSSRYKRWQQGYQNTQKQAIDKKTWYGSRNSDF